MACSHFCNEEGYRRFQSCSISVRFPYICFFIVPTETLVHSSRAEYVYDLPGSKDEIVPKEEKKEAGRRVWV